MELQRSENSLWNRIHFRRRSRGIIFNRIQCSSIWYHTLDASFINFSFSVHQVDSAQFSLSFAFAIESRDMTKSMCSIQQINLSIKMGIYRTAQCIELSSCCVYFVRAFCSTRSMFIAITSTASSHGMPRCRWKWQKNAYRWPVHWLESYLRTRGVGYGNTIPRNLIFIFCLIIGGIVHWRSTERSSPSSAFTVITYSMRSHGNLRSIRLKIDTISIYFFSRSVKTRRRAVRTKYRVTRAIPQNYCKKSY